jgi:hypothetical protein
MVIDVQPQLPENPEKNITNPGDSSSEIRDVPRILAGHQLLRSASTDPEGGQLTGGEFAFFTFLTLLYRYRPAPRFPYIPHDGVPRGYPTLDFKPIALRTWFLVTTMIFFFACLGSISAIVVLDHTSQATLHIHAQRGFLALRYLPGIIGTITLMWWRSIGAALFHITPYISMAGAKAQPSISSDRRRRSVLTTYQDFFFSTRYSTIRLLVSEKNWLMLGIILLQIALALFVVPAKNVFIQLLPDNNGWIVSVSRIAAGFLITMYSLLIICTIYLVLWFQDRQTGLKWDAACIADQIALIQGSNILESFHGLEFATRGEARDALASIGSSRGVLRLGYWQHKKAQNTFWHGIAFLPLPAG